MEDWVQLIPYFLALCILAGILAFSYYLIRKVKKGRIELPKKDENQKKYQIFGGWLLVFFITLVFSVAGELMEFLNSIPMLKDCLMIRQIDIRVTLYAGCFFLSAVILAGLYWIMCMNVRKPRKKSKEWIVKCLFFVPCTCLLFFLLRFLLLLSMGGFSSTLVSDMVSALVSSLVPAVHAIVWLIYFTKSKRVSQFYIQEPESQRK